MSLTWFSTVPSVTSEGKQMAVPTVLMDVRRIYLVSRQARLVSVSRAFRIILLTVSPEGGFS